jgi:hypothetical protein
VLLLWLHGAEPFFRSRQLCSYSRTSQHFKAPKSLLPCSQEPSTGPCPVHTTASYFLTSILILSIHLRLGLPSGLFTSGSPQISYMHSFSPHSCYMLCPSHPPWLYHSNYIWWRVKAMKLLIMQFSPTSCHFIPLWSKYSPQYLLLISSWIRFWFVTIPILTYNFNIFLYLQLCLINCFLPYEFQLHKTKHFSSPPCVLLTCLSYHI